MKKIKTTTGSMFPLIAVFILVLMVLTAYLFEYFQCYTVSKQVHEALQISTTTVAQENYSDIYSDLKVAFTADKSFKSQEAALDTEVLDVNALITAFCNSTGSVNTNGVCVFADEKNIPVYEVSDINGMISLGGYVTTDTDGSLMFPVTSTARVLVHPGGIMSGMAAIEFNITSSSDWTPRF